ncbi:hypothetical protein BLNAU_20124 [Blattamonas nauphoetae]|uniref:Uncharacterized protein n=1 Tax=Blattamonas nauphoetae TaxID=2049346 RepID=A0ABQ9WZJ8_9EUKA|nr:hypothetical protein BLNAU_20124 [Blattamonas nauphoetae]
MGAEKSKIDASTYYQCPDRSRFLDWDEEDLETEDEKAIVFQSLVATLKLQPALDVSLEAKAVKLLESVNPQHIDLADAFLGKLASFSDDSSPDFVQSIVVLISSPSQAITTTAMRILESLSLWCSAQVFYPLVKADLIPQLVTTLNPLSLSFTDAVDIHTSFMRSIRESLWLTSPNGLEHLGIEDESGQLTMEQLIGHEPSGTGMVTDKNQRQFRTVPGFYWTANTSRSMVATLSFSFAATLALLTLLVCGRHCVHRSSVGDDFGFQQSSADF